MNSDTSHPFNVDFERLATILLPPTLRRGVLQAFASAVGSGFNIIHSALYSFHCARPTGMRYRLTHNGQICYLKTVLNDYFDPEERRIFIADAESNAQLYTFHTSELEAQSYLSTHTTYADEDEPPVYAFLITEVMTDDSPDFAVVCPAELINRETTITSVVDKYKLVTKTYKLLFI